jgi:transcriptional regulator GlxA family with amidase domain
VDLAAFGHVIQPRLNELDGIYIPVKFTTSQPARFREVMLKMVGTWQLHDPMSQLEAQHLATELVLLLVKDYSEASSTAAQSPQSLNWITSYLSFHLSESLSVADMARRANLSPTRFSAVFRQRFGLSPHQYLLHLRIQHAQDLLKSTDLPLQHVAEYSGFADVHHFSKAFKKVTKITPGAFRRATLRP